MRTLPAELTAALDSGNYTAYHRIELGDGVHWLLSIEPISYTLEPLSMRARFELSYSLGDAFGENDIPYVRLVRGVLIDDVSYDIISSVFYLTSAVWDGTQSIEASIVPPQKYAASGDGTYEDVIEAFCENYGLTAVFANPSAAWWDYQFLPDGKQIILNDANRFFNLLRQKYLIFACDDGGGQIKFFHISSLFPAVLGTISAEDVLTISKSDIFYRRRQYLWRDEAGTIHNAGDATAPVHNLGFLPSTASAPSVTTDSGQRRSVIAPRLEWQTGDSVSVNYAVGGFDFTQGIGWLHVVEKLDRSKSMPWFCEISVIDWFSNTEGGALPSTIERVAAYTPLVTTNFNGNLDATVNNLQAFADRVDDLELGGDVATDIHAAPAESLSNADEVGFWRSATGLLAKITWANVKAALRAYFDTLYQAAGSYVTTARTISTTAPLSGGGDLSANRTLTISAATTSAEGSMSAADKTKLNGLPTPSYGIATLASYYGLSGTAGTFYDTGLSVTLPAAGTYRVTADVRSTMKGNAGTLWWISVKLYNSTDAADVSNSERLVVLTASSGVLLENSCSITTIVTVAASKVVKLYAKRDGQTSPTWTNSTVDSDVNGRTSMTYELIAP